MQIGNCRLNKHFSNLLRKVADVRHGACATGTVIRGRYVLKCRSRRKLTLYIFIKEKEVVFKTVMMSGIFSYNYS